MHARSLRRDYYDVLGVPRDAEPGQMRRAFHALAREVHPDVATSVEAAEQFTELAEAYGVLSNPEKRLLYDRFGVRGNSTGFSDRLFDLALRDGGAAGLDLFTELALGYYEASLGTTRTVRLVGEDACGRCAGDGRTGRVARCGACGGTGSRKMVSERREGRLLQVETCAACRGSGHTGGDECSRCEGTGRLEVRRTIRVRIPAGIEDGQTVRVRGEGLRDPADGARGDAFVLVRVHAPPRERMSIRLLSLVGLLVTLALMAKLVVG